MTPDAFQGSCAAIARRYDPERYSACLFAPAGRRDALLAVLAANHEIAKTAEMVSDPTIGRIRLQWWLETFDGIEAGRPRAHEVAVPLARAVAGHGLRLDRLRRIVDARDADLDGGAPATLDDLTGYAAATAGELHAALAEILGGDADVARESGTAWGLVGLMRAAPAIIRAGRSPFPEALLQDYNLTTEYIRDHGRSVQLNGLVRKVLQVANRKVESAGRRVESRDSRLRPLRLLADRTLDHLAALRRVGDEPYALAVVAPEPAALAWRHAWRMLRYRLRL